LFLGYTLHHDIIFLTFTIGFLSKKRFFIKKNIFNLLILILIINSIRGFINFDFDLLKIRWVIFFSTTLLFANYISQTSFSFSKNFHKKLVYILVFKNVIYLGFGIGAEILGIGRYELQPGHESSFIFGTTAYFLFTNILFIIPLNYLKGIKFKKQILLLVLILTNVIYYDSRVSLIITLLFAVLLFFEFKLKKLIQLLFLVPVLVFVLGTFLASSDFWKIYNTVNSPQESTTSVNDFDRFSHIAGATNFTFNFDDFPYNFIGYGTRTSSFTIGKEITNYFNSVGVNLKFFKESDYLNIGTNSYSGFLMDNGLIFPIIIFLIIYKIIRRSFRYNITSQVLVFTGSLVLYLFVIDLRDLPILYLLFSSTILFKLFKINNEVH